MVSPAVRFAPRVPALSRAIPCAPSKEAPVEAAPTTPLPRTHRTEPTKGGFWRALTTSAAAVMLGVTIGLSAAPAQAQTITNASPPPVSTHAVTLAVTPPAPLTGGAPLGAADSTRTPEIRRVDTSETAPDRLDLKTRSDRTGTRLFFSMTNDNTFTVFGKKSDGTFGAGDDFGLTHAHRIGVELLRHEGKYLFDLESTLYTRDTGLRRQDGDRTIAVQQPVEITSLHFALRTDDGAWHTTLGGSLGIRNQGVEIPGLATWAQQRFHEMLPRAATFDNVGDEVKPFATLNAARGIEAPLLGRGTIGAELGVEASTFLPASSLSALVEAKLPIGGGLTLTAAQIAKLFAQPRVRFETQLGLELDANLVLVGVEGRIRAGSPDLSLTRFDDNEPLITLKVGVPLSGF